jgi:D-sedoheptulose 7-phosphate isomerase
MEKVVFTNGCFDILHPGHIDLLERARALGTKLVIGINSDASVRAIKGPPRPFVNQGDRAEILMGLRSVDEVRVFDEATPAKLIEEVKPDILVKGGDWPISQIVGAEFVLKHGGQVLSLPLKDGYSSSALVEKIQNKQQNTQMTENITANNSITRSIEEHLEVFSRLLNECTDSIEQSGEIIYGALAAGKKVLLCGNGGSAADCQHIAAEFVGRFEDERRPLPSIALTTDTSLLTAVSNDYGYDKVFVRQVLALANEGDVLIGISTSGNSESILSAIMAAREKNCKTIGLTGSNGKKLASLCDAAVLVPSARTARIQEGHIAIGHIWCEMVDAKLREEA